MVAQTNRYNGWHLYAGVHSRNRLLSHARRQAMADRRESPRWRWPLLSAGLLALMVAAGCTPQEPTFAGTWKTRCGNYWGLQIRQVGNGFYAVTFCGLSGCLEHGLWTPDTRIEGDPMYEVISDKEIRVRRKDGGFFTYARCSTATEWPNGTGWTGEGGIQAVWRSGDPMLRRRARARHRWRGSGSRSSPGPQLRPANRLQRLRASSR